MPRYGIVAHVGSGVETFEVGNTTGVGRMVVGGRGREAFRDGRSRLR